MGLLKAARKSTTMAHKGTSLSALTGRLQARASSNHYFLVRPVLNTSFYWAFKLELFLSYDSNLFCFCVAVFVFTSSSKSC